MDSIRRKQSVCRSLFGPVDHDQLRRDLKLRVKEIMDQDRRRWNFDFQTETPLSGRFQWEEIPTTCAAALYRLSPPPRDVCASNSEGEDRLREQKGEPGADQENCSSISNTHKCPTDGAPVRRKRTLSKSADKLADYARITDFFPKRRRTSETKVPLHHFHSCSAETSMCRTIR